MKQRFRLYRRKQGGRYYIHNELTGKQESLHTNDRAKATRLLHAKNEAGEPPAINLQIARAYLAATDPQIATRTWQLVMDERFQRPLLCGQFDPLTILGFAFSPNGWQLAALKIRMLFQNPRRVTTHHLCVLTGIA